MKDDIKRWLMLTKRWLKEDWKCLKDEQNMNESGTKNEQNMNERQIEDKWKLI